MTSGHVHPAAALNVLPSQSANFRALWRLAKDRDTAGVLAYISTDNVPRDMLRIAEAHGETKLLYLGISYVHAFLTLVFI